MKTTSIRLAAMASGLVLASPALLAAHEGHAGDHGWLAGAVQPLLALDHFLAALFVVALGGLGAAAAARLVRSRRGVSRI